MAVTLFEEQVMHYQDIAQIKEAYLKLDDKLEQALRKIEDLQSLLAQAADALSYQSTFIAAHCCDGYPDTSDLIDHLRKAAQ